MRWRSSDRRSPGSLDTRPRVSLLALLALAVVGPGGMGCRPRGEGAKRVPFATQVAYGRPDTCPDDAVDPYGDGSPSPMDLRCSYADGTGSILTRVRGRVSIEGPPGSPGDSPGRVEVVVHEAPRALEGPLGRRVAHATTDPQGGFSVGAMLRAGEYVLVVPDPAGGRPLVQQRLVVGGEAGHRLDDVRLTIPRPMDEAKGDATDEEGSEGEREAP